jgi:hypothetical protein
MIEAEASHISVPSGRGDEKREPYAHSLESPEEGARELLDLRREPGSAAEDVGPRR